MNALSRLLARFTFLRWMALLGLMLGAAHPALAAKTYSDNGDGTVTDPTTGLQWMRCAMGQTWYGNTCTGTASGHTWDQANALTGTVTFAGQNDWRVPSIRELQTITDRALNSAAIDPAVFPLLGYTTPWDRPFWASTENVVPEVEQPLRAWFVQFGTDQGGYSIGGGVKSMAYSVRMVRDGLSFGALLNLARPTLDYVDHGDGTATHTPTGLMWQRCSKGMTWIGGTCSGSVTPLTWNSAMTLSDSFAGHNDWRLPTIEELETLVDYTAFTSMNVSINPAIFPATPAGRGESEYFWSASTSISSSNSQGGDYAWNIPFYWGDILAYPKTLARPVRLVRADQSISTFVLTVTKTGSGIVSSSLPSIYCGSTCTANYTSGTTVILTATPGSGGTFDGWGGACSGTSTTCTVTMSAAQSVTAHFTDHPLASGLPASLTFASQIMGTVSSTQNATLSNTGLASLDISSIAATGDFAQTNNCGTSLAAGASCTLIITFTPSSTGTRTGTLTITSNAAASPSTINLSGLGILGVPGAPNSVTASAGNAQASIAFTAPAGNGGSAITGYTATSNPGGLTNSGCTNNSPCSVAGLVNGTAYTFTVTATNSIGTGAASAASNSVTPVGISQVITFGTAPTVVSGGTGTVSATGGGSGNAVTFSTNTPGNCSISGNTVSGLASGSCTIAAAQTGNTNYYAAPTVTQTFTIGKASSSASLSASSNPVGLQQPLTLTTTVAGYQVSGTVTFKDGTTTLTGCDAVTLANGLATCSSTTLTMGSHSITAIYSGDANNLGSTSPTLTQVVNVAPSTTTLSSATNPSTVGQRITLTASVAGITPSGTVTFNDGASPLAGCSAVPLSNNQAGCTTEGLTVGNHSLTAVYSGDTNNAVSTSTPLAQVVDKGTSATAVSSSANPAKVGNSVTFTATVTAPLPSGTVAFTDGGIVLTGCSAVPLSGTQASCVAPSLGAGLHGVAAIYSGDALNAASTSAPLLAQMVFRSLEGSSGVPRISAGGDHSCALTASGAVKCWGKNTTGQLGNGGLSSSSVPVAVFGLSSGIQAIATGWSHSCALSTAGGVKCWGANFSGQLGNNSTTNALKPVQVTGLTTGVAAIAAGGDHTCALTIDGGVQCWGANASGQLGNSGTQDSSVPSPATNLGSGIVAIATGGLHTCALTNNGAVRCWGANGFGQLGNGSTTGSALSLPVTSLSTGVVTIAAGGWHTCAVTGNGSVSCWGYNSDGQLGNGGSANSSTPAPVTNLETMGVGALAAGDYHNCALTAAGDVKCWGRNGSGQLGNGSTTNAAVPVAVIGLMPEVMAVTAGGLHSCALTGSGKLQCWGGAGGLYFGQLGDGESVGQVTASTEVLGLSLLFAGSAASATTLGASPSTSVMAGQTMTLTAQVNGSSGTPSGSVVFRDGNTSLMTVNLSAGSASYLTNALTAGAHSLSADYSGDSVYLSSQGSLSVTVASLVSTSLTTGTAPNPSQAGQSVTVTVGVTPASSAGALGGTVTVSGAGASCTITLPATSCTLVFASNGVKRLTASYTGGGAYSGSTGAITHYVGKKTVDLTPILMLLLD